MRAATYWLREALPGAIGIGSSKISTLSNWVGRFLADRTLVGDHASEWRVGMEMRIVVPDAASATALAEQLTVALGAERISLREDRPEIGVRIGRESDRAVLRVLDTVERWLDQAGVSFAEMWLGKRSYRAVRWVPAEARQ